MEYEKSIRPSFLCPNGGQNRLPTALIGSTVKYYIELGECTSSRLPEGEVAVNKIEAIIRPEKLTCVKDALADAGLVGMNVFHVIGRGAQKGLAAGGTHSVRNIVVDMLPKVKLELVVTEADTQRAIAIIMSSAKTGNVGDGKIFVIPVADAVCIRTGEHGDQAIKPGMDSQPPVQREAHADLASFVG